MCCKSSKYYLQKRLHSQPAMINYTTVFACVLAYLLGSVPSAVWVGRAFYGIDVREYGSGNAGATNTFRVLGKRAGIPVLLMDIAKGYLAVQMATILSLYLGDLKTVTLLGTSIDFASIKTPMPGTQQFVNFKLALGVCALIGHIFPVYVGFRGGKGVATTLGIVAGCHPQAALICALIFFITFAVTNYISLSSMIAGFAFPLIIWLVFGETITTMNVFAMTVAIIILITHQKNIERLLRGEESKMYLYKRKATNEAS